MCFIKKDNIDNNFYIILENKYNNNTFKNYFKYFKKT